jgi:imidazolonepropionase-like amidohydrolase
MRTHFPLLALPLLAAAAHAAPPRDIALTHVTVIDMTGAPPRPDMTVVLTGEKIAALGPSKKLRPPKGAQVVDATGKYLVPGFWDMHAHPDDPELWPVKPRDEEKELLLPLLIAHGVTGIRDMGGDLKLLQAWRQRITGGTLTGPRIVACGPLLDGPNPMWPGSVGIANEEEARRAVRDLKSQGADFIKVYSLLPRAAYFAIADEAKKVGLPFAGHVPDAVTPAEASDAGQASEEHLLQLVEEASDRDAVRAQLKALRDAGASPIERRRAFIDLTLSTYNPDKAQALYARFAKNKTWHTPTVVVWYNNAHFEEDKAKYEERLPYLPRYIREYWDPKNNAHLQNRSPERLAAEKRLVAKYLEVVGGLQRAGVRLMTGSDFGANPLLFPGWGVHDELELLVRAGLKPEEALIAATRHPAEFLGLGDRLGTIAPGKLADLILLDADPLADIRNTQRIAAVFYGGKLLDQAGRRAVFDKARTAAEATGK